MEFILGGARLDSCMLCDVWMNRQFFSDADAAVKAAAPNSFNSKMLRAAEPARKNPVIRNRKGKPDKWNQEEESRRAICERNKLLHPRTHPMPLLSQSNIAEHCPTDRAATNRGPECSSCPSVTDASDDCASEISSPCSRHSLSQLVEDVETRRNCGAERDSQWSPDLIGGCADALANSDLLSPVLHLSMMSLGDLRTISGILDSSVDHNCPPFFDFHYQEVLPRANFVVETPANASRIPVTTCSSSDTVGDGGVSAGCEKNSATLSPCASIPPFVLEPCEEAGHAAVVPETPFKNERCEGQTDACGIQIPLHPETAANDGADAELEVGKQSEQGETQAENLLMDFASIRLNQAAKSCDEWNMVVNANVVAKSEERSSSLVTVFHEEKSGKDHVPEQINSPIIPFSTLQSALTFYSGHRQQNSLHVWAEEFSPAGARKFLVATCDTFARYSSGPRFSGGRRHFYEVIPEACPCNMYVDVEWTRKEGANSWIDATSVMQTLVQRLCAFLSTVFAGVQCGPKNILHLDSSTREKFSRHLILNAVSIADNGESPIHALFADNVHAGAFMADFVANEAKVAGLAVGQVIDQHALQKLHETNEAARLFCFNMDGALTFCIDTGIYNKNRCFRLPLSSKCGKSALLIPHCSNEMPLDGSDTCLLKSSLVCPCDAGPVRLLSHLRALQSEDVRNRTVFSSLRLSRSQRSLDFTSRTNVHRSDCGSKKSIDESILDDWATKTGLSGQCCGIKASIVSGGCLVSYALTKANRWCERVGRQHRSNCTFLVADMCAGEYWQSCWDEDCKGFKSKAHAIPGWNTESVCTQDKSASDDSTRRNSAIEGKPFPAWATERNFVDAELHEELIWLEAAIVCDGYSNATACHSEVALCPPVSDIAAAPKIDTACMDIEEWYSGDIEAEISKLEQQQRSICEAQLAFESALLQWRPVPESLQLPAAKSTKD